MNPRKLLAPFALCLLLSTSALAGKEGGGGDFRAIRFVKMGEHILKYLEKREAAAPGSVSSRVSLSALKQAIGETDVESTLRKLERDGAAKDALNYPERKHVDFNRDAWDAVIDNQTKSILVLHEYLGILKLEEDVRPYPVSGGLLGDDFAKNWPELPKLLSDGGCSSDEDTLEANREKAERVARAATSGMFRIDSYTLAGAIDTRNFTARLLDELNSPSLMVDQIGPRVAWLQQNGRNVSNMREYVNREGAYCSTLVFRKANLKVTRRKGANPGQYVFRVSAMTSDGYSGGYTILRFNYEFTAKIERAEQTYVLLANSLPLLKGVDEIDCNMRMGHAGPDAPECGTLE